MKKSLFVLLYLATFCCAAQSITLSPTSSYPFTVKTGGSGAGYYGDIATSGTSGLQYYYVSSTPTSLGTTVGNIFGSASRFGMNSETSLILRTASADRMTILSDGKVGIGLSAPNHHFEVLNTGNAMPGWGAYNRYVRIATATNGSHTSVNDNYDAIGLAAFAANANFANNNNNVGVLGTTAVGGFDNFGVYGYQNGTFSGGSYGYGVKGEINQTGTGNAYGVYASSYGTGSGTKYGIYASATGTGTKYAGYFSGNVYISGDFYYTGSFSATSDEKLKKNLKIIDSSIDKVMALNPSTYEYKTDEFSSMNLSKGNHFGFTAQGVQKIFPELVTEKTIDNASAENRKDTSTTTYLSINYIEIIPILTKAIQEQQVMIKDLQAEVVKLKNK